MDAEPVTPLAPRPVRTTLLNQRWRDVAFLHWAVDPGAVAPLLPAGLRSDTVDGRTYVGLVALGQLRTGFLGTPPLPYLGSFAETNVRLYTVDNQGRRGVLFRSMDAGRLLPVLAGRAAAGLPYRWSRLRVARSGPHRAFSVHGRRGGPDSAFLVTVGGRIAEPSELELFLTARWGLHLARRRALRYWPNEHPEWTLHRARLVRISDGLIEAATGLSIVDGEPASVLVSPGLPVRFGRPVS
jgi:uncharacterized protein